MTPTMSEYFGQWKQSRFIAGANAEEQSFAASSRLQDIEDILGGLVLIYGNVAAGRRGGAPSQAAQTGKELEGLHAFAADLRRKEQRGTRFDRRAGRHARRRGAAARRGDRGPGLAGGAQLGIDLEA